MDDRLRTQGAVAAAAISGLVAVAAVAIGRLEIVAMGAALGVPVGAVLGFRNAPRVAHQTAGQAFGSALAMAGRAVVLGDLVVSIGWVVMAMLAALGGAGAPVDPAGLVVALFGLPIIGLLVLGLPAFALAFGVIWPWTFVIRWLGSESGSTDGGRRRERAPAAR